MPIDLTNKIFDRLTVLYRDNTNGRFWVCRCQCGNITKVNSKHLKRGNIKSCGCLRQEIINNRSLIGRTYGYWTVIKLMPLHAKYKASRLLCRCRCGTEKIVDRGRLISGRSLSCGCWRAELQRTKAYDLIGQTFGNWTVIKRDTLMFNNWIVQCSCFHKTIRSVAGYELKEGNSTSCGCLHHKTSRWEKEIITYLTDILGTSSVACNIPLFNNLRPDILMEKQKLVIECNGVYWHSAVVNSSEDHRWQHFNRRLLFSTLGYRTVFLWEDDWRKRQHAIKSYLRSLVESTNIVYDARKLSIFDISHNAAQKFFEDNHPQGGTSGKHLYFGLKNNTELVACMSFSFNSRPILGKAMTAELTRYATIGRVRGGASRLLQEFIRSNPAIQKIISFSDNDYFTGDMYGSIGFTYAGEVAPDYMTVWNKERRHKSFTKRRNLIKLAQQGWLTFDPNTMSEAVCLAINGIRRTWNSGKKRWIYINSAIQRI